MYFEAVFFFYLGFLISFCRMKKEKDVRLLSATTKVPIKSRDVNGLPRTSHNFTMKSPNYCLIFVCGRDAVICRVIVLFTTSFKLMII